MCYKYIRREVWLARLMRYMSGSSSMALCARNAHITVYDVTTWRWVNLVHPSSTTAIVACSTNNRVVRTASDDSCGGGLYSPRIREGAT